MLKKIFLFIVVFFTSFLYAHKIPGITLNAKLLENDQIQIKAFNKRSKKMLNGNKIKLFAQASNKVLFEGFLKNGLLITKVPKQPYMIFMYVGSQDVVTEGLEPKSGFSGIYASKINRAFYYSLALCLFFIFASMVLIFKNFFIKKVSKRNLMESKFN